MPNSKQSSYICHVIGNIVAEGNGVERGVLMTGQDSPDFVLEPKIPWQDTLGRPGRVMAKHTSTQHTASHNRRSLDDADRVSRPLLSGRSLGRLLTNGTSARRSWAATCGKQRRSDCIAYRIPIAL
jgi:hypothetical protein